MGKKILVINEYYSYGGAEVFFRNVMEQLKLRDNIVLGIVLRPENFENIEDCVMIDCSGVKNKIFYNRKIYRNIKRVIDDFSPNVIIVNNVFSGYVSVYKALKNYKVIQVVHDYKIICPNSKSNYLFDGQVCSGRKFFKCCKCEGYKNWIKMALRYYIMVRCAHIRRKFGFSLICPSQALNKKVIEDGFTSICINNPLPDSLNNIATKSFLEKSIDLIYVGLVCDEKGIFDLLENCYKNKDFKITIVGGAKNQADELKLINYINHNHNIVWKGKVQHSKTLELIANSKFMIVPSKWAENYPTTIIESMFLKTVVIGSDRGGIPEMLSDGKGIAFSYDKISNMYSLLNSVKKMSIKQYNDIVDKAFNFVKTNNSIDSYFEKLENCF